MQSTLWERLFRTFIGDQVSVRLSEPDLWLTLAIGMGFGVLTILILILLGRYFVRWGYEEVWISRGRDSLDRRKRRSNATGSPVRGIRTRRQRRLPERPAKEGE